MFDRGLTIYMFHFVSLMSSHIQFYFHRSYSSSENHENPFFYFYNNLISIIVPRVIYHMTMIFH